MNQAASHWVFGYGSLIWRPGFAFVDAQRALLKGAHRSLCIYSHTYRGTPERPGLVFGLARGGACGGMAFEVTDSAWEHVLAYLRERELVSGVYQEVTRAVRLADGRTVGALAYLVDPHHAQYAGQLNLAAQARIVLAGEGQSGSNLEYVVNTHTHLDQIGIADRHLAALAAMLRLEQQQVA